jgi:integrase
VVVLALVYHFLQLGEDSAAFLVAAGFDGFLRTRELLSLVFADVGLDERGGGVISLAHTKVGQQNAAFEASVINDPLVPALYKRAVGSAPTGTSSNAYIFPGSEARFYELFATALEALGLERIGFRPYSLRRGGATAHYRATRNMSSTIERGRWSSVRIARIYINDGLAKEVEIQLALTSDSMLRRKAAAVLSALQVGQLGSAHPAPAIQ